MRAHGPDHAHQRDQAGPTIPMAGDASHGSGFDGSLQARSLDGSATLQLRFRKSLKFLLKFEVYF